MFKKNVEEKKYTSVYNSQANPSTNLKTPPNSSFSRNYLSSSMTKAPATSASKNSVIKNDFLRSSAPPSDSSFRREFGRASTSKLAAGRTGLSTTSTITSTKNTFLSDDKFRSYSSSSSTSINRINNYETTTHTTYEMKSGTSAFSPTFGPTPMFNSKYENGMQTVLTPSFRSPIMTTSGGFSSKIGTTPVATQPVYKRPTISAVDVTTRPEMKHLPLKSFMKT